MHYQGPENIYWLFSSSAQSIAALIGFITAGFYFVLGRYDNNTTNDSTLDEINQEVQRYLFVKVRILCGLTAISIISSLALVYVNGFDFQFKNLAVIVVSLVNIITILWAIFFVVKIIDPQKINKAVDRLLKTDKELLKPIVDTKIQKVAISEFIEVFTSFEDSVRTICSQFKLNNFLSVDSNKAESLSLLIRAMYQKGLVDSATFNQMNEVNKIRNLIIHGEISMIDKRIFDMLITLLEKMISIQIK